jgi:hypothetical protein
MKPEKSRNQLLQEFESAPLDALFSQKTPAAVLNLSEATFERHRWAGTGIPFIKLSPRCCRYRKSDIVAWLNKHQSLQSTSQADAAESSNELLADKCNQGGSN